MKGRTPLMSSRAVLGWYYEQLALDQKIALVEGLMGAPFNSDQESETYAWLGMVPAMREWIGGRNPKSLSETSLTLTNKEYEATLDILLKDWRRDKTGQYEVRVREMTTRGGNPHWASLLCALILAGESTVCYDNQYFFDTDHSEGSSGKQSNLLSIDISALATSVHGSTTAPSPGEVSICIQRAIQAIMGFKDDQGEPFNETASQFMVVAGTNLLEPINAALSNQFLASGEMNALVNGKGFDISAQFSARLTSLTDRFDVYRTDGSVKPFIRQEEVPLTPSMIAEGSELEFNENRWRFGVYASRTAGVGLWQHACRIIMT